jgi:hypothetical protein
VCFVNDYEVIAIGVPHLMEAAARYYINVVKLEFGDGLLPGVAHGGRDNDQSASDVDGVAI